MFVDLEKIEILDGFLCFNPYFLILALIVLLHFFYSWHRSYTRTGWKLDVWHLSLFLSYILPCVIMYPFFSSEMNALSTGSAYVRIGQYVEEAFFISLIGYISILMGKVFYDGKQHCYKDFGLLGNIVVTNIRRGAMMYIWSILCIVFFAVAFYISLSSGMLFNGRGWFLTHPSYRFIANFMVGIYTLCFLYLGARLLTGIGTVWDKALLIIFPFCSIMWGSRSVLFGSLFLLFCYWYYLHPSVSLKKIFFVGVGFVICVMLLGVLRGSGGVNESSSMSLLIAFFNIFYGNTFSDGRDFAWMLSGFDGDFQLGKTYISGIFSFLPSDLFSWRREYAMGVYTLDLAGISNDSGEHPGLRGGLFYELFFNFSYPGVILGGVFIGYLLACADRGMRYFIGNEKDIIKGYVMGLPYLLLVNSLSTAGMFKVYIIIGFHLLTLFCNAFLFPRSVPKSPSS